MINQINADLKSHQIRQINILSLKSRTTKVILAVLSSSLACGMPNVFSNLLQAQQMANIVKAVLCDTQLNEIISERKDHRRTLQNFAHDEYALVSWLRLESDYLHVSKTRNAVTSRSKFVKTFRSLLIRRFNKFVRRISNLGKIRPPRNHFRVFFRNSKSIWGFLRKHNCDDGWRIRLARRK